MAQSNMDYVRKAMKCGEITAMPNTPPTPAELVEAVCEAIEWADNEMSHELDETCCCSKKCRACKQQQTRWKSWWNKDYNPIADALASLDTLAARVAAMEAVVEAAKNWKAAWIGADDPDCQCEFCALARSVDAINALEAGK